MISTALCLHKKNLKDIELLVGTNNLKEGGTRYKVCMVSPHDKFDVAMVRIKHKVIFSTSVQPIKCSEEEVQPDSVVQLSKHPI